LGQRKLDAAAKTALVDGFNSAALLKLASHKELGAVLGPMIDDWLRSAEAYRRDPARLAAAAEQLGEPNEARRAQAAVVLSRAREAAVAPVVDILADPKRAARHAAARQMLVYLGEVAVEPLLGVLESPDPALKSQVIDVLGQLRAPQAIPQLLGPLVSPASTQELRAAARRAAAQISGGVPNASDALRMLQIAAQTPLEASRDEGSQTAEPAEVWHWNAKRRQSMSVAYDATGAALARAVRLARELYAIDPANAARRRLYLTAMLQAAKFRGGLDKPLATGPGTAYAVAAYYGPEVIDDLLGHAIAERYIPAATAAAQILGDIGSAALLARGGAQPSPLAQAAAHADRRLRFAGTAAIMKLAPSEPFAGSSQVTSALGFFARSYGVPRILIAHPRSEEAQTMAGLAAALGYATDMATNGRRAFELAVSSPDYDFALVHSAIDRPRVDDLVAQLRRDRRTALLPIGLIATLDDMDRVERFARDTTRAVALLQPRSDAEMKLYAGQVLARGGRWHVSAAERRSQAIAALDWLVALAERPKGVFDVYSQQAAVEGALYVPELSPAAAAFLGELGTATAQRSLLELADLATQGPEARQAAATAFARSTGEFGLLVTRDEILHQYNLYNANAGHNADTHAVLSAVLDAIERKNAPTGGP
jgi:HEAT repeat protein